MSKINPVKTTPARADSAHLNWMGGPSWDLSSPVARLRMAAASSFFGEPQYYAKDKDAKPRPRVGRRVSPSDGRSLSTSELNHLRSTLNALDPAEWRSMGPTEIMEKSIDEALVADPLGTLDLAVTLRNEDMIRVTPQVILVRAANFKGRPTQGWAGDAWHGLVRVKARDIIKRPDEIATQLAYQMERFGKPIPNQLKKAWSDAYERFDDYSLAKYRQSSRAVKLVDPANLVHPASDSVNRLMRGELTLGNDKTWESIISAKGSNTESWTEAVDVMGHMALLRNVRNLLDNKVSTGLWLEKLIAGVPDGKQLPFRYLSAYKAIDRATVPGPVLDALETCIQASFANAPHFAGRTMSLCDNSGSAWGTTTSEMGTMHIAEIANLTAVVTGCLSDDGYVGIFGDRLETFSVRKSASVFDQVEKASTLGHGIGGGTEHGIWLFWDRAIREAQHWDNVFVYSDMQAGHGGLYGRGGYSNFLWQGGSYIDVPKLISTYRAKVNPKVNVYLVQVAGYKDTIVPEYYDRTFILSGWSPGILKFAAAVGSQ